MLENLKLLHYNIAIQVQGLFADRADLVPLISQFGSYICSMITSPDFQMSTFIHSNYVQIQMYLDTALKLVSEAYSLSICTVLCRLLYITDIPEYYWLVQVIVAIGHMDGWIPNGALNL